MKTKYGNLLKKYKKLIIFTLIAIVAMGLVCLLMISQLEIFFKDPSILKETLLGYGDIGKGLLSCVMALQVVFVFLPGEIIEILAGYAYGPTLGLILCLIGAAIGSCIIYGLVYLFGRPLVDTLLMDKNALEQVTFLKDAKRLKWLLFIVFFIPGTPKDILTYMMPFTPIKLFDFLWISSIARIPSIITSTIGGNALGMEKYAFSVLVFIITALISIVGLWIYKKFISKQKIIKG